MKFFYAIVCEVTFYGVRVTSSPLATCVTKEPGHHVYTVMHRIAGTYGDVGSPPFFGILVNPFPHISLVDYLVQETIATSMYYYTASNSTVK